MKISLAEVRLILENKEKYLKTLFRRREDCLLNIYKREDGKKELMHGEHEFSVDGLTKEIEGLKKEIRKLRLYATTANVNTLVDFTIDGENITLQEAIYLIKQYREEAPALRKMGEMKTTSEIVDPLRFSSNYEEVKEPTFNTKNYRREAERLEKLITKLELAINKANLTCEVEIDFLSDEE